MRPPTLTAEEAASVFRAFAQMTPRPLAPAEVAKVRRIAKNEYPYLPRPELLPEPRPEAWQRTQVGIGAEKQGWVERELRDAGLSVVPQEYIAPFDLLVNGCRVDVKSSGLSTTEYGVQKYRFSGLKRGAFCDAFVLVYDAGEGQRMALVRAAELPITSLAVTLGHGTRWEQLVGATVANAGDAAMFFRGLSPLVEPTPEALRWAEQRVRSRT